MGLWSVVTVVELVSQTLPLLSAIVKDNNNLTSRVESCCDLTSRSLSSENCSGGKRLTGAYMRNVIELCVNFSA